MTRQREQHVLQVRVDSQKQIQNTHCNQEPAWIKLMFGILGSNRCAAALIIQTTVLQFFTAGNVNA
jgi:hypothetical protein